MSHQRDVVIVGGGHNGLVTAFYLAKAGVKPLVLERRPVVGGAAISGEFHPGFKCSTLAHMTGPLSPTVARDMQLARRGLEMIRPDPVVFAPLPDGHALTLYDDAAKSSAEIARFSKRDAEKYVELQQVLARMAAMLRHVMASTPPAIDRPTAGDLWSLFSTGRKFRALGKRDMFRLLRWGPMAVADFAAEWFETELMRALVAARGIFGAFLGPWSGGSTAGLLVRAAADPHPAGGAWFARGGMGSLTEAMARAAADAGTEIRTGAEVAQTRIKGGVASGVVLADGEEIDARAVISNADPRRTFLGLVGPAHLAPEFLTRVQNYRSFGAVAKINLALAALPSFRALGAGAAAPRPELGGRIHIGPDIDYLERAFDDAKYGGLSRRPYLNIAIPSVTDSALAGKHVMSIYAQFAPYKLTGGWTAERREALRNSVIATLAEYAPDLPSLVLDAQVITPLDLEATYGLTGGHIFHGEMALDQLFTGRPLLGWARYRTPIRGLYLCGSGTHPGAGLTGWSGSNAAREFLKDWKTLKHA